MTAHEHQSTTGDLNQATSLPQVNFPKALLPNSEPSIASREVISMILAANGTGIRSLARQIIDQYPGGLVSADFTYRPEWSLNLGQRFLNRQTETLCLQSLFGEAVTKLDPTGQKKLAKAIFSGSSLAFSFPIWRFLSEPLLESKTTSVMQHLGGKKLFRETDRLYEDGKVVGDRLGSAYIWESATAYVEYRRAYLLYSDKTSGTQFLSRNSNFYFGRQQLPHALYFSDTNIDQRDLAALDENQLADSRFWTPVLSESFTKRFIATKQLESFCQTVKSLIDFEIALASKLYNFSTNKAEDPLKNLTKEHSPVFESLLQYLELKVATHSNKLFLSFIDPEKAPFSPLLSMSVNTELIEAIKDCISNPDCEKLAQQHPHIVNFFTQGYNNGYRLSVLSGPNGDLPFGRLK